MNKVSKFSPLGVTDLNNFKGVKIPNHGTLTFEGKTYTLTAFLPEQGKFAFADDRYLYTFTGSLEKFSREYDYLLKEDEMS